MRKTSLLDLPSECLHHVYDMLHVQDRMRLNMALPVKMRVYRTLNTDAVVDRSLAVIWKVSRDKLLWDAFDNHYNQIQKKHSTSLVKFLEKHCLDPTVQALLDEGILQKDIHERVMSAVVAIKENRSQNPPFLEQFIKHVLGGTLTEERLKYLSDHLDLRVIADELMSNYTIVPALKPVQFDMIISNLFGGLVERWLACTSGVLAKELLFRYLLHGNRAMVQHILDSGAKFGIDVGSCIEYVTTGCGNGLLTSHVRCVVLDLIPLAKEHREKVVCSMICDLSADSLIKYQLRKNDI